MSFDFSFCAVGDWSEFSRFWRRESGRVMVVGKDDGEAIWSWLRSRGKVQKSSEIDLPCWFLFIGKSMAVGFERVEHKMIGFIYAH